MLCRRLRSLPVYIAFAFQFLKYIKYIKMKTRDIIGNEKNFFVKCGSV